MAKTESKVPSSVLTNFTTLPKSAQDAVSKLLAQIETVVGPAKRQEYDSLVELIVGLNPQEYADGDIAARHIASQILTYFDIVRKQ